MIDLVGLNSLTDTDYVIGVELDERSSDGNVYPFAAFSVPSHQYWQTDFEATGVEINDRNDKEWVIHVEQAGSPNNQWFGYVTVHWHRRVSPPPAVATFNDVPTNHPFFQYIEALNAAGITGGCQASPPLYCPDATLTRGQMAVFLAKALGLHWPN